MATLRKDVLTRHKRKKRIAILIFLIVVIAISPWIAELLDCLLRGTMEDFGSFTYNLDYGYCLDKLLSQKNRMVLILAMLIVIGCFLLFNISAVDQTIVNAKTIKIAKNIIIPTPAGNGECGTSWFLSEKKKKEIFEECVYSPKTGFKGLSNKASIIVDFQKHGKKEYIKYIDAAMHSIVFGTTGIGKTRRQLLTSIWLCLHAGNNICVSDVKGEIYAYTSGFAKKRGYREIVYDLKNPEKGMHINYMQEIVEQLQKGDISEATDKTWDLVSTLVGEVKGEKIWNDGECATIASVILLVAQDAPAICKNMTNVYYFLAYMCEADEEGNIPINNFLQELPEHHPARAAYQVAKIAPFRTRTSFFTSALATLRLFTSYGIAEMTSYSDYKFDDLDEQKMIIYMIIPDQKLTRYDLCSLYVNQMYSKLVDIAESKGGMLKHKFIFKLDEFGNFPVIPGMGAKMSAARGRNIFFELFIQDYQQIQKKYKDDFKNICSNALLEYYLKSTDEDSLEILSKKCGNYTLEKGGASSSASEGRGTNVSYSTSAGLDGRRVLFPDEIKKIEPPEALVFYNGQDVAVVNLPDISQYYANKELGLGNEEFNAELYQRIHNSREKREVRPPEVWGIWNQYKVVPEEKILDSKKVSFL